MYITIVPINPMKGIVRKKVSLDLPVTVDWDGGYERTEKYRIVIDSLTYIPDLGFFVPADNRDITAFDIAGVRLCLR